MEVMAEVEVEVQNETAAVEEDVGPSPASSAVEVEGHDGGDEPMTVDEPDGNESSPSPPPPVPTYAELEQRLKKIEDEMDYLIQRNLGIQISSVALTMAIANLSDPDIDAILLDRSGDETSPAGNFSSQASSTGSKKSGTSQEQLDAENEAMERKYEEMCQELDKAGC